MVCPFHSMPCKQLLLAVRANAVTGQAIRYIVYIYHPEIAGSPRNSFRASEKRNEFKVSSLDQLDNNTALVDKIADSNNQYDTFNVNEEVENVMNSINQLSEEDKNLITNLLIKNKTERELSALMGVSQPAIHKRKKRIIENIKNKSKK